MIQLDVNAVLGAGASLVVVVTGIGAGLLWFRRWVRSQVAAPAQAAAKQLQTSNGKTVANYVETITADVAALKEAHATTAEQASTALALARHTSDRLDAHLSGHNDKHTI